MNEVIEMPRQQGALVNAGRMSAMEVVAHTAAVQEVMRAVMKPDVHYGKIPGTPKPTLYKAGAEVLCMSFRIADEYRIDDLSTSDMIRYRVTCIGKHQTSGAELGSGMGEASTGEEKYKWRGAVCDEEFEITPATHRRVKFGKKQGGFYKANQVRTEPSDLANTVLKMACKRAKMAMVLNVTAASDIFSQDLDDLDDTLRDHLAGQEGGGEPVISALGVKLVVEANAVTTREQFDMLWKRAVKEINAAKDAPASDAFKAAMAAKSKTLPAKVAEQAATAKAPDPQREPGSDDAEMEAEFQRQLAAEGEQQ